MSRHTLHLTLESDAIFTARGGTVGRPDTLERVPGAALLGAAAGRLYARLTPEQQVAVFHTGAVRFGDGLPLSTSGAVGLPTPAAWHTPKEGGGVIDLSLEARGAAQVSQLRGQWVYPVAGGWERQRLPTTESMRTAIDESGRAREGLLYGFVSVRAGARYEVIIDADDDALGQRVVDALCSAKLRLGRSRGTEYGLATVAVAPPSPSPDAATSARARLVRVLCVSDLALVDPVTGAASLLPAATDVGLDAGWTFDPNRSFLRFRRYSPFNGTRARPDRERQVIEAGSVLTFAHLSDAPPLDRMRRAVAAGVGEHREAGLGRLLVEPRVLEEARPTLRGSAEVSVSTPAEAPPGALASWLVWRSARSAAEQNVWEQAEKMAQTEACKWRVSRSQWGVVRTLAAESRSQADPLAHLRSRWDATLNAGVAADVWKNHHPRLRAWMDTLGASGLDGVDVVTALQLLAARVPRHMGGDRD